MSKFKNHKLLFQNNKLIIYFWIILHVVNNALILMFLYLYEMVVKSDFITV